MNNNEHYIDQNALTIIVAVKPERHEMIKKLLMQIGADEKGGGIIHFEKVKSLHFARWFLIEHAGISNGHGGISEDNKYPVSLAFTSNFDGEGKRHLQELINASRDAIIELYSHCLAFPEGSPIRDEQVIAYMMSHLHKNQLFWPAVRGGTVAQIKGEALLRDRIQDYLNKHAFHDKSASAIRNEIINFVKGEEDLSWALQPMAKPRLAWNIKYYGILVFKLLALPFVLMTLGIWRILVASFNKRDNKHRGEIIRAQDFERLLQNEDRIFMNQLTVYAAIKKPYWYRRTQLRIGLWLFALNGVYRSNKGKLSGMETIHFARWCIFNDGKNVMFLSNFDGAWQLYLSNFIDKSASAMNLTFGTTVGYPLVKGFLREGAHNEQAFKTVVRNNQYPCQVWYSAYPALTTQNILNNREIRKGVAGASKESPADWLKRF